MNIDVVCAGIVIADVVARPVSNLPERGQLALVDGISLTIGGSAANTGAQLVRLGHGVALVGRVGRDSFGEALRRDLTRLGLHLEGLLTDETAPTSATIVHVDDTGERTFLHALGANAHVQADDLRLPEWRVAGARVLHVAGFHILPTLEGQLPDVFRAATELGLITSLDCVWDASGQWNAIRSALLHTDVFCPSLSEAQGITGVQEPRAVAEKLLELGVRQAVAVKMGERGSLVQARGQAPIIVNAPQVNALDGTGAGDAFIAGFLTAWLRGLSWEDAARLGNAAGGQCARVVGGTNGLKSFEDTWALARTLTTRAEP